MEAKAEMEKCLESALQRVVSLDKQEFLPQLNHILRLAKQKDQILSAQILAEKELHTPPQDDTTLSAAAQMDLQLPVDDRQSALINHGLVKDTLQSAALNIQMQEAVQNGMQQMNVDDTMDHFPQRGELLAHCGSNLHACKELASVQEEMANLDKEILHLQTEYSSTLQEIKPKWKALQDRDIQVQEESQPLAQLQRKAIERDNKVQLLVTMIQGLIASCGFKWGDSEYFTQVKRLCDSVSLDQDPALQDALMNQIVRIHEDNKNQENRSTLKKMLSGHKP